MKAPGRPLTAGPVSIWLSLAAAAVAQGQPPLRIGASVSQSGAYAALGQNQLRGYQLCLKHTNEKGGVLGRGLALVVEDDRSEPAAAVRPGVRGMPGLRGSRQARGLP